MNKFYFFISLFILASLKASEPTSPVLKGQAEKFNRLSQLYTQYDQLKASAQQAGERVEAHIKEGLAKEAEAIIADPSREFEVTYYVEPIFEKFNRMQYQRMKQELAELKKEIQTLSSELGIEYRDPDMGKSVLTSPRRSPALRAGKASLRSPARVSPKKISPEKSPTLGQNLSKRFESQKTASMASSSPEISQIKSPSLSPSKTPQGWGADGFDVSQLDPI